MTTKLTTHSALFNSLLGKAALNQLVFENALSLYKIPVTLSQKLSDA